MKNTLVALCICLTIFNSKASLILRDAGKDTNLAEQSDHSLKLETFENSQYYIGFTFEGTWFQALQYCKLLNMDLVSIETEAENDFLYEKMKLLFGGDDEYRFWSSGTTFSYDKWAWMGTGQPIKYFNWMPKQPDNVKNDKCLEIRYHKHDGLLWNDENQNKDLHVICESNISKTV
ncbi:perlucin-like isoform X2 [Diabrotica undecimpunctata]|uniref:perlucin-like isoform X2 n=1 Tax=Diabrotica undecimpunctata TaxID=50387 RepID=UPI003B63A610